MNTFELELFDKGYIKLQHGSYRKWISKKWHNMFVRRGLVRMNLYEQFCPNRKNLQEFIHWLKLYDKVEHDRDFPNGELWLNPIDIEEIRLTII